MENYTVMKDLQFHEAANIFPMMTDEEANSLLDDIRERGQQYAIELYDGKILDGRNRYLACLKLGIECDTTDVTADVDDPVKHVLSANLHRRHLTASQKAMIGDKARELFDKRAKDRQAAAIKIRDEKGRAKSSPGKDTISGQTARDEAGKAVGVSGSLIDRARTVREKGTPELAKAVEEGRMSVSNAAKLAEEDAETSSSILPFDAKLKQVASKRRNIRDVGVERATEAIACLKRIPRSDPLRKRGYQMVADYIKHNINK